MAASVSVARGALSFRNNITCESKKKANEVVSSQSREMITPSVTELTKEVRTNILCTVEGCAKILPNTPALNMHLVKSHGIKDGLVNPTVRKEMKSSQKLYCCPAKGCPRGPSRPFSQFALVKQHFMKIHAEKKHKCLNCSNCYGTKGDLRRHAQDCGKMYSCTCGCPYASRAALLSHVYRTGHELPIEHRDPPVKKRKMEGLFGGATKITPVHQNFQVLSMLACPSGTGSQNPSPFEDIEELLQPKQHVALVNVPVVQFAHLPVLLSSADFKNSRSVVLAVNGPGSVQLLSQLTGTVVTTPGMQTLSFRDTTAISKSSQDPVNEVMHTKSESMASHHHLACDMGHQDRSTSTLIQTSGSLFSKCSPPLLSSPVGESPVSSFSQTCISVGSQALLPVSVETQTFPFISALTDFSPHCVTRETQTIGSLGDQTALCVDLPDNVSLSVSTQTGVKEKPFKPAEEPLNGGVSAPHDDGSARALLHPNPMAETPTQTMTLLRDLENILADATDSCGVGLAPVQVQNGGMDFDIEEFLNPAHIQTQTLNHETPLGSLDIETQTDYLFFNGPACDVISNNRASSTSFAQETYDIQTQTDMKFLLNTDNHVPPGSVLLHSAFSGNTDSFDSGTQTNMYPARLSDIDNGQVKLESTETQTVTGSRLEDLFLTSNETQTALDDHWQLTQPGML